MNSNARWAVIFIIAAALAGIVLIASAGSASAAKISGTVTDNSKTPVPGATVTLFQDNQEYVTSNNPATTDATGYYEFAGLPPGDYSVMAEIGGYTYSGTIHLDSGDKTLGLQILGYTYTPVMPTPPLNIVTVLPTPVPTPTSTPKPTPTPAPKPSNTLVPLPTPQAGPGFEALMAVIALGLLAVVKRSRRQ